GARERVPRTPVPVGEAMSKGGVSAPRGGVADGLGQCPTRPHQNHQPLGPGDGRVEQVALQHHPGTGGDGYDHRRVLASLGTVHGDGVGVREFVEFGEVVGDLLVLVGAYAHLLGNRFDTRDHTQRAVEHTVLAFFVIVADLGDLVADLEDTPTETTLGHVVGRGGDGFLQPGVEVDRTGRAALHGGEDLYVPARVEPETTWDTASHHVHGHLRGGVGVLTGEEEEVVHPLPEGWLARVDPVGVGHHTGLLRLPEDMGQSHARDG